MRSNSELVRLFHQAIGDPPPPGPSVPDPRTLDLRSRLITEEYEEVMSAVEQLSSRPGPHPDTDLAALVHELTDLLYATYGTLIACGVEPDEVFGELHRANMRKVSGPKREDGKQMRPPDWAPADVAGVIELQRGRNKAPSSE